jgi:hypothetical protein
MAAMLLLSIFVIAWIDRTALGHFEAWQQASEFARPYLRGWRALLYVVLFTLWWDVRRRYRHRPRDRSRIKRLGTLALMLCACVELTQL